MPVPKPALLCHLGIRQFFSRNLVKLTPCLTPPRIYPKSDKAKLKLPCNLTGLTMIFFTSAGDFRQVHGHHQCMNGQEVLAMGSITSDRGLGRRSLPDLHSLTKNTSLGHKDRDILQPDTRAVALGMQSYRRSYFCLLNVIFGCVSTEISIQFLTWIFPNPNRIEYSAC